MLELGELMKVVAYLQEINAQKTIVGPAELALCHDF